MESAFQAFANKVDTVFFISFYGLLDNGSSHLYFVFVGSINGHHRGGSSIREFVSIIFLVFLLFCLALSFVLLR